MPNWCDNYVTFTNSDTSKIDALEAVLLPEGSEEVFNTIRPIPLEEEDNSYDWHIQNWGTKWEARVYDFHRDDNDINISFETAWCPPIALYEWMTEQGWEVDAIYNEPGQGFAGQFSEGEDDYYAYDLSDEDSWKNIPLDIQEFADLEGYAEWLKVCEE